MAELLQIGEVAARTELSVKTIRHYDEVGLVTPSSRSGGGFRLYTDDDVSRLIAIRRMKPLGFTLDEMRELLCALDVVAAGNAGAAARRDAEAYLGQCQHRAQEACVTLARQLRYAEEFLAQLAASAPCGGAAES